jgi:hypothetical protein
MQWHWRFSAALKFFFRSEQEFVADLARSVFD